MSAAAQLFAGMDNAYEAVAVRLGFNCLGCEDNCCRSLFFHHTLIEYFWLQSGFALLPDAQQDQIRSRSARVMVHQAGSEGQETDEGRRPMCPLNIDDRCSLYAHRPMICRLHGIPHELHRPGGRTQTGPGCDALYRLGSAKNPDEVRLDRTPWYTALAQLERQLRDRSGYGARIKMTIAQMILEEPQGLEIPV
jgi:hypothetical protein